MAWYRSNTVPLLMYLLLSKDISLACRKFSSIFFLPILGSSSWMGELKLGGGGGGQSGEGEREIPVCYPPPPPHSVTSLD